MRRCDRRRCDLLLLLATDGRWLKRLSLADRSFGPLRRLTRTEVVRGSKLGIDIGCPHSKSVSENCPVGELSYTFKLYVS